MDVDRERPIFTSPWADTYVKGGKQFRFSQASGEPDAFVGYGGNRTEPPTGTWFDLMRAAYGVLASRNTLRAVDGTRVPGRIHLPGGVPDALDYFEEPYRRDERPYSPDSGDLWPEREIEVSADLRFTLAPGTNDKWVTIHPDADAPSRPVATWWELMRASALILSSPNTREAFDGLRGDLPPTVRRRLPFDRDAITDAFTPKSRPYQFEAGVGTNANPRGAFDF